MKPTSLLLTYRNRSINLDSAFDVVAKASSIRLIRLSKFQARHLGWTLWRLKTRRYHKVLVDLPFKYIQSQARYLRDTQQLFIYEEDACQDRLSGSKWQGQFTDFYRSLPNLTLLTTGYATADHFISQGIRARFAPKGYDDSVLVFDETQPRSIRLGFIGRLTAAVYAHRKEMLEAARERLGCQLLRTTSIDEYRTALHSIRFFLSADIGLGEYMAKNFEALACGCVLVAWRQGNGEEARLGLEDGVNCILYSSLDEADEKIRGVEANPDRYRAIQREGIRLARERYSHTMLGELFVSFLS